MAWKTAKTADGKTYYYHPVTKEVAWDDPEKGGKIHKPPGADLVQGHGHAHDHDHGHGHEDLEDALPPPAPGGDGDGAPDGAVRLPDDVRRGVRGRHGRSRAVAPRRRRREPCMRATATGGRC